MKRNKIISFLMLAVLSFTFSGCSSVKKDEPKVEINHKIVGKWSGKAFTGDKVAVNFTKSGEATHSTGDKEVAKEKYRVVDDTTIEFETKSGMKYEVKMEFSDNDNTLTLADATKIKTTYKRQ